MIAVPPMRWGAVLILVAGAVLPCDRGWSQTAPVTPPASETAPVTPPASITVDTPPATPPASATVEEWQTTDQSLLDLIEAGYEVISVISRSSQTRIYFLTKPGEIVKCQEDATPNSPPAIPPPPPTPGQAGMFIPPPPDSSVTSVQTEFECAELSRVSRPKD